jgi:hypothetical protein
MDRPGGRSPAETGPRAGEEQPGQRPRGGAHVRVNLSGCGCLVALVAMLFLVLFIAGSVMASAW